MVAIPNLYSNSFLFGLLSHRDFGCDNTKEQET